MRKLVVHDLNTQLGADICAAAGIEPSMVRRIVLDLEVGRAGIAYVEAFVDEEVLHVSPSALGIEISIDETAQPAGEPQRVEIEPAGDEAVAGGGDEDDGEAAA